MARCDVCDLDLDEIERFCPGCGTPAPRRVAEVSTTLRESFYGATEDDLDAEYAFGSNRRVKSAPPPPRPPEPDVAVAEAEPEDVAIAEAEPEVLIDLDEEPEDEVVSVQIPQEEDEAPTEDEVVDLTLEVDDLGEDTEAVTTDPEPGVAEPGFGEPPSAEAEDRPGTGERHDEQREDISSRTAAEAPVRPEPVVAAPVRVTPYVVIPPPRRAVAVAVHELPPSVEVVDEPVPTPRRRGRTAVLVVLVVVAAAGVIAFAMVGREPYPVGSPFTAEATDGSISLDAPAGWRLESRGPGVLGIGEATHDRHVHATAIRRSSLDDGLSLARRAKDVQKEFLASLEGAEASPAAETKVGPYPAVRQILTTESVVYVHTVVKMPKHFVNVLGWTTAQRFPDDEEALLDVVGSLQTSG